MATRAAVLYDGECGLCQASVRRLRALDSRGRLEFADARDPAVLARFPQVRAADALARLQLVTEPGAPPLEGFEAFRWIAGRLPIFWIVWPFLWLPGMTSLGARVYDAVARNRFAFGRCDGACEIPPGTAGHDHAASPEGRGSVNP
jgi:predicted DCC family thiol-disulfide oxidoreductase YuxK